jgi:hypothetical protein
MPASFIQALAYRRGGKVLLILGLFAMLSLTFATFGPDQVLARVPDKAPFREGVRKHIMKRGVIVIEKPRAIGIFYFCSN